MMNNQPTAESPDHLLMEAIERHFPRRKSLTPPPAEKLDSAHMHRCLEAAAVISRR
jgi:hypothetical protein